MERGKDLFLREEYVHLRLESLDAIKHRSQIIALSLAAVGAAFAGALALEPTNNRVLILLIFNLGIPAVLMLTFLIWFSELERMVRAGNYLTVLEAMINRRFEDEVMQWEQWLRQSGSQMTYTYAAGAALLLGPAAGMPFVGIEAAQVGYLRYWFTWAFPVAMLFLVVILVRRRATGLQEQSRWATAVAAAGSMP